MAVELDFSVEGLDALRAKLENYGDTYKTAYALALNDLSPQIITAFEPCFLSEPEKCGGAFESLAPLTGYQFTFRNISRAS